MIKPSGSVKYIDDYGQIHESEWSNQDGVLDITTITKSPFVWGSQQSGYVENGIRYVEGVITVERQIIVTTSDGYEIRSQGFDQYIDYFETNQPCSPKPVDQFKYHLDSSVGDQLGFIVSEGSRWADPDNPADDEAIWAFVTNDGSIDDSVTATGGIDVLTWINVW